jgi:hypothetical protein
MDESATVGFSDKLAVFARTEMDPTSFSVPKGNCHRSILGGGAANNVIVVGALYKSGCPERICLYLFIFVYICLYLFIFVYTS